MTLIVPHNIFEVAHIPPYFETILAVNPAVNFLVLPKAQDIFHTEVFRANVVLKCSNDVN